MNRNSDVKNGEILFLYDANMCNPNGDPDEENRPRMDDVTRRALVSDVRLKRYLRDYWFENENTLNIRDVWVRKNDNGNVTTADNRLKDLKKRYKEITGRDPEDKDSTGDFKNWLLDELIDVRLFGAVMPIVSSKTGSKSGGHITYTGPVQFSWGYSLHPVEINPSNSITSTFAGRESQGKGEYGTIGKDWRVMYALIAFYGVISKARATKTNMKEDDLKLLRESLIKAIPAQSTTRSKIGQVPRLYVEVDYTGDFQGIGDLRDLVELKPESKSASEEIRGTKDYIIDMKNLQEKLKQIQDKVASVYIWVHPSLRIINNTDLPKESRIEI